MKPTTVQKLLSFAIIMLIPVTAGCIFDDDDKKDKDNNENTGDSSHGKIFITTAVWGESGNTAVYNIETSAFTDNLLPISQDNIAKTDGTYLYILERSGADAISKYDPSNISAGSHIFQFSTGESSNPYDIVFSGSKAYLLLYGSNKIWIINPEAADEASFKMGEIDISQWADDDGFAEPTIGFYYNGMVYVVLQRYDQTSYTAGTSVLIKINPSTDGIVDMNIKTNSIDGLNLIVKNIVSGSLYENLLYLAGSTYGVSDEGVLKIDLDDLEYSQSKIITETTAGGNMAGVVVFEDGTGCISVYDETYTIIIPRYFDIATGSLGSKLPVPDAGGGIVMAGDYLYIGATEYGNPGMYIVDTLSNETVGEMFPTELQPSSIVYIGNN
ncbi:hypothetical protein ACFL50_03340 [Candidatus Latescibacterota bacterium]